MALCGRFQDAYGESLDAERCLGRPAGGWWTGSRRHLGAVESPHGRGRGYGRARVCFGRQVDILFWEGQLLGGLGA